jgi:Fe-S-cluster containining protein
MKPWYLEGVKFKCTGCGACCSKEPGAVFISEQEAASMAEYLQISLEHFYQLYTRKLHGLTSLKEKENFDCVFLIDNRCSLYESRPKQCKTYPFWPELLESKEAWEEEKQRCEGLDHPEGEYFSFNLIRTIAKD